MECYKCPVCEGRGTVPADFYTPGGYTINTAPCTCKSCNGKGVIWGLDTYSEFENSGKAEIEDVHSYTNYCQPMQAYSRICKNCKYSRLYDENWIVDSFYKKYSDKIRYCGMRCMDVIESLTCKDFYPKDELMQGLE